MTAPQAMFPTVAARLAVKVAPRASRTAWAGRHGDAVRIRVAAPPVDNRANRELVRFLAEELGVAASRISVAGGAASAHKILVIQGLAPDELARRVAAKME